MIRSTCDACSVEKDCHEQYARSATGYLGCVLHLCSDCGGFEQHICNTCDNGFVLKDGSCDTCRCPEAALCA